MREIRLDQLFAILILPFALVILGLLYVVVVALQGRPFLFASERMRSPEKAFRLYKIRTMHPPDPEMEEMVLSGRQAERVTPIGRFLRRTRLDEGLSFGRFLRGRGGRRLLGPRGAG